MSTGWAKCLHCNVLFPSGPKNCPSCGKGALPDQSACKWFVIQNKKKIGPHTLSQLKDFLTSGQLSSEDMVLEQGSRKWVPLSSVHHLQENAFTSAGLKTASPPQPHRTGQIETVAETRKDPAVTTDFTSQKSALPISGDKAKTLLPSIPGYLILETIGRGGMGVVYKANQVQLKRVVALKMILGGSHAGESDLARFRTEAEAVARLQHPNIVQIHEVGEHEGQPFFSLEYVEGGSLAKKLEGVPLLPKQAAEFTRILALGVEAAHQRGVVHRDLKPANILLAGPPETPLADCIPKIADFGLAKHIDEDSNQTRTGAILGTPSYMSPEQASGQSKAIGPATDVYALGAILYEFLTGRPPFRAATMLETLDQVRQEEPVPPRTLQPRLPRDLDTICLKCLNKEPSQRYVTAQSLANDLDRFLNNQPILARPAGPFERAGKFIRRHKILAASVTSIIAILLVALFVTNFFRTREQTAQREKTKSLQEMYYSLAEAERKDGNLKEALNYYHQSLEEGHPDYFGIKLKMAKVYSVVFQPELAEDILDGLERKSGVEKYKGSILLLRGDLALTKDPDKSLTYIRKALKYDLPKAEEAFARAMLAQTTSEAAKHFRIAVDEDRYFHSAHAGLAMTLFFLGRLDEADEIAAIGSEGLFPQDSQYNILRSFIAAIRGNKDQANAFLEKAKKGLTPQMYQSLKSPGLEIMTIMGQLDKASSDPNFVAKLQQWRSKLPMIQQNVPILFGLNNPSTDSKKPLRLPPILSNAFREVVYAFLALAVNPNSEETLNRLKQAIDRNPEGTLYTLYGVLLRVRGRFAEAEPVLLKALDMPSMGNIKRVALFNAIVCEASLTSQGGPEIPALIQRGYSNVKKMIRFKSLSFDESIIAGQIAFVAKDYPLARYLADRAYEINPEDKTVFQLQVRLALSTGNPQAAHQTALKYLRFYPEDGEAIRYRDRALAEMRKLVGIE